MNSELFFSTVIAASAMAVAALAGPVGGGEAGGAATGDAAGERLLLGFEKEELRGLMAKAKNRTYGFFEERGEEILFLEKSWGYGDWVSKKPHVAVKCQAPQGEYALRTEVGVRNTDQGELFRPDIDTIRTDAVLATFTYWERGSAYDSLFPRDWSGWPVLRMDLFIERKNGFDTAFFLDISDDIILPPAKASFTVPANKWVTLEFDLERAAAERGLATDKICLLLLRLSARQKSDVPAGSYRPETFACLLDNIRLARREAKAAFPVLRDEAGFKAVFPKAYAVEYEFAKSDKGREYARWRLREMKLPEAAAPPRVACPAKADASSIAIAELGNVLINSIGLLEPAAYDAERMLIPFSCGLSPAFSSAAVLGSQPNGILVYATGNGGKTWTGPDGGKPPCKLTEGHHSAGWCAAVGGDLFGFCDFGCFSTGWSYPIDKGFCRRTVLVEGGTKWWISPYFFVDPHGQHCINEQVAVADAAGRVWTAWAQPGVNGGDTCLSWSEDGGMTWRGCNGDGKLPRIPRFRGGSVQLAPFGGGVAVFVREGPEKGGWMIFDGKTWSELKSCPLPYRMRVVASGGELFVYAPAGVWRFDGQAWKKEKIPELPDAAKEGPAPQMAVCGSSVLCFALDAAKTKLMMWRLEGGAWTGPAEAASEPTPISGFACQRYPQAGFVPVSYMCAEEEGPVQEAMKEAKTESQRRAVRRLKPWIKVLRVPVAK